MNLDKVVKLGLKWTTLSTIIVAITAILKMSILARFLEKADFGLMAIVTLIISFLELFNNLGITTAVLHKQNIETKQYSSLFWLNIIVGLIMYSILCLLSSVISQFYSMEKLIELIPIVGVILLLSSIGRLHRTIEQKLLSFKAISIIDIISACASLLFALYLANNNYGVYSLAYSAILQYFLSNFMILIVGYKKIPISTHFKLNETIPFLKIGIYQVGGQFINYINRDLDLILIGKFYNTDILGAYSLARELVRRPISLIEPILNKVGAPTLSTFNSDLNKLKFFYLKLVNTVSSVTIPLYILIILLAKPIVLILYGEQFISIAFIVQILAVNMTIRVISGVTANLVIATGKTKIDFYWNVFGLLVSPIFILIGIQYSIDIVALSITSGSIILFIPTYYLYVRNLIQVSFKEYLKAFFIIKKIKI